MEIVSEYDDRWLHSWKITMRMPAVVRLLNFFRAPFFKTNLQKFNRRAIWERDDGICQYCGRKVSLNNFTFDHIIPRTRGGKCCFENIVCACYECNSLKSGKTPAEAGLKLLKTPVRPRVERSALVLHFRIGKIKHKSWLDYLYWEAEIEEG